MWQIVLEITLSGVELDATQNKFMLRKNVTGAPFESVGATSKNYRGHLENPTSHGKVMCEHQMGNMYDVLYEYSHIGCELL